MRIGANGLVYTTTLYSYLYWRKETNNWKAVEEATGKRYPSTTAIITEYFGSETVLCPRCNGDRTIEIENGTVVQCLCCLSRKATEFNQDIAGKRSPMNGRFFLQQLEIWDSPDKSATLQAAIHAAWDFLFDPRRWLILIGGFGCGKSHMLKAIAYQLGPYALYLSADDFKDHLHRGMEEKNLNEYLFTIRNAPFLLFDDLGIEHSTDYVKSQFRAIVNYRYNMWPHLPLVVSTNMGPVEMAKFDGRIDSRLDDKSKTDRVTILVGDYRRRGVQ